MAQKTSALLNLSKSVTVDTCLIRSFCSRRRRRRRHCRQDIATRYNETPHPFSSPSQWAPGFADPVRNVARGQWSFGQFRSASITTPAFRLTSIPPFSVIHHRATTARTPAELQTCRGHRLRSVVSRVLFIAPTNWSRALPPGTETDRRRRSLWSRSGLCGY